MDKIQIRKRRAVDMAEVRSGPPDGSPEGSPDAPGGLPDELSLRNSVEEHVGNVRNLMRAATMLLLTNANLHDWDRIQSVSEYAMAYAAGDGGEREWRDSHRENERYHLEDWYDPRTVTLAEVFEWMADSIASDLENGGEAKYRRLPDDVVSCAVRNTYLLMMNLAEEAGDE